MSTPNFEIEDKRGRKFWISRSIVVIPFTFKVVGNYLYTLIEKRGKSVSSTGKWCCPCGYLDFDETLEEACIREVKEETGVEVDVNDVHFINYNSSPLEASQNVGMRFVCFVSPDVNIDMSKIETKDEVDDVMWLKIGEFKYNNGYIDGTLGKLEFDYKNMSSVDWTFGHDILIREVLEQFYKRYFRYETSIGYIL